MKNGVEVTPGMQTELEALRRENEFLKSMLHIHGNGHKMELPSVEVANFQNFADADEGELKAVQAEMESIIYALSHDLQEPVRMVSAFIQLVKNKLDPDKSRELGDLSKIAQSSVERINLMINNLLELSRIERKVKPFAQINSDIALQLALRELKTNINETGARIKIVKELPMVFADVMQLTSAFKHIIHNSIKFRRDKLPKIKIDFSENKQETMFIISDNGAGIPDQHLEKVFAVFSKLSSNKNNKGFGLGLTICKRIVEKHRGSIWLESVPGEGTTVYFTIPKPQPGE